MGNEPIHLHRYVPGQPATDQSWIMVQDEPGAETIRVPVLKVFDGDGFLTRLGNRDIAVRFGFTDAPELDQPGGVQSKAILETLIFDRWVEIVILVKQDTGGIVDRYGRIVCVPYLCDAFTIGAMRNLELEMVVNGWSWVIERYGPDERYLDALEDARRHRRGIWAFGDNLEPWEFKRRRYRNRQRPERNPQPNLFSEISAVDECPQGCGGRLTKRNGRFGPFIGCTNFPRCHHSSSC